jgi:hypothetical protein
MLAARMTSATMKAGFRTETRPRSFILRRSIACSDQSHRPSDATIGASQGHGEDFGGSFSRASSASASARFRAWMSRTISSSERASVMPSTPRARCPSQPGHSRGWDATRRCIELSQAQSMPGPDRTPIAGRRRYPTRHVIGFGPGGRVSHRCG